MRLLTMRVAALAELPGPTDRPLARSAFAWAVASALVLLAVCSARCVSGPRATTPADRAREGETDGSNEQARIPPLYRCTEPDDCMVTYTSCCGQCGAATRGDAAAVNAAWLAEHGMRRPGCGIGTGTVTCPACAGANDPELLATCRHHRCTLVDLATDPTTACTSQTDCTWRAASCCGCGGPIVGVARSADGAFRELTCGSSPACEEVCAPTDDAPPHCVAGHCRTSVVE